jgi:Flp pilus assembly protein TadG
MRLPGYFSEERGQSIVMFMVIFTVITMVGAVAVDVGLWLSERRGAQTDADLPALAGAAELMILDAGSAEADSARAFAEDFLVRNDESGNASLSEPVLVDDSCFSSDPRDRPGVPDSVTVRVRHETTVLFGRFFGLAVPDIGAHAKACAGSLRSTTGLRPWTLSMYHSECFEWNDDGDGVKDYPEDEFLPWYGEDCVIRLESPSSQVGSIRLGPDPGDECNEPSAGGAEKYKENIVEGSDAWCEIDDLIDTEPGLKVGPTYQALVDLLASEGECDSEYCADVSGGMCNGMDEFAESFTPADIAPTHDDVYQPNACTTPRAVDIVIIDEFTDPTGMSTVPIQGFAAFFILQCEVIDPGTGEVLAVYPGCDVPPGDRSNSQIRGRFMQVLKLEGSGGPMDTFGTKTIFLVE